MSQVEQLMEQMYYLASEAKQGISGLSTFQQRFSATSQHVQALIGGSATRADLEIIQLLGAASTSLTDAVASLSEAAAGCARYASQI